MPQDVNANLSHQIKKYKKKFTQEMLVVDEQTRGKGGFWKS
jgi:hypothetical protein